MVYLRITNELRGDLGELYFKHLCQQRGYAYIKLEDIYKTLTPKGVLEFKFGFDRISIAIPEDIIDEIWRVCRPIYIDGSPAFVFDFLTYRLGERYYIDDINNAKVEGFNWVEIKTGDSTLSERQNNISKRCRIPFSIFRIRDVNVSPYNINIEWEY